MLTVGPPTAAEESKTDGGIPVVAALFLFGGFLKRLINDEI